MDTEDHADIMSLLNMHQDTIIPVTLREGSIVPEDMQNDSDGPYVHADERTCNHCVRLSSCWSDVNVGSIPFNFRYRSGWDEDRYLHHMRGVTGQICGNFQHRNGEINTRHVQAERRRREENGEGNEWDEEQN